MNKHLITSILMLTLALCASSTVYAKKPAGPPPPSAEAQKAMTDKFYNALDNGAKALNDLLADTSNHGTQEEVTMLDNLKNGKAADGGVAKGFRGDPNDPGPTDWSDWNIETDANGNVTGFKERDFEQKDKDGDGEISKAERDAWNKDKKKQDDERGGPVGDNYHPPDWDKNEDGKPDPDFHLDCWQCVMPTEPVCNDGEAGPCSGYACDKGMQCYEHTETHGNQSLVCHSCGPTETIVQECEGLGFMSDASCNGQCPAIACIGVDVDKDTSRVVLPNQTRAKGSTVRCYQCMKIKEVVVEYVVIIIETSRYRVILEKAGQAPTSFVPSSVMVLADKEKLADAMKKLSPLAGGGFDPSSLMQNALGMDKVSNLLQETLAKGGKFTDDCFGALKSFMPSMPSLLPPPFGGKASKAMAALSPGGAGGGGLPSIPGVDALSELTSLGPVVACGMSGADKILQVFDADGRPAATLTKDDAKSKPEAVLNALQKAQELSEKTLSFASNPVGSLWKTMFKPSPAKAVSGDTYPNDPYFNKSPLAKKKKKKIKVSFGGMDLSPAAALADLEERKNQQKEVPIDQWGLKEVGYLPKSDPDSAWNIIDGQTPNVTVAVIDSGFDATHPDGPEHVWTNAGEVPDNGIDDDGNGYIDDIHGWNFLDNNAKLTDGKGHGTFVAGIIAAKTNNGVGIAGINPGAVIMPIKVADDKGDTNSLNIFRAVQYGVSNGASVINVSLGNRIPSDLEQMAFNYARAHDVFVAVASGNFNEDIMNSGPAAAAGAFSVGAIDRIGTRSTVSNWGANNGLLAPGEQIYSLLSADKVESILPSLKKAGIYPMSGTSFSTPIVAATASLMRALHPDYSQEQIEDILQVTADDLDEPGWDSENGAGLLNASEALKYQWTGHELVAKVTRIRLNYDNRKRLDSVDVFATVRGDVKDYVIELGKGKHAGKFHPVSISYTKPASYGWAARIDGKEFNGSDDWTVRVRATSSSGETVTAQALIDLKTK